MRKLAGFFALLAACGGSGGEGSSTADGASTAQASSRNPLPDACTLLTQAEAEEVLGTLVRAPYPDSTGKGCAYETAGNQKFIITPEWTYGKFELDTERMVGGMVAMVGAGQDAVADTLEGPWDEAAFGVQDAVFRVKARALRITYVNSGTDLAGAVKLAGPALKRVAAVPEPERPKVASGQCPLSAEAVSEILGQEVRIAPGQGSRMGACDFDLVVDPTIQVELRVQPANLAEMVYDGMKTRAKAIRGEEYELNRIDVGEGGMSWGSSNNGGEAAALSNGKVYHAYLGTGFISTMSVPEEVFVKLVERMIQ